MRPWGSQEGLGPLEAQAFPQAQLPEIEVEGREASLGQAPRRDDGQRCKGGVASSWRRTEEGSTGRAGPARDSLERAGLSRPVAEAPVCFVLREAWLSSLANWLGGGWGGGDALKALSES